MRYYDIAIADSSGNTRLHYTSHPNGPMMPPDPGALDVALDLIVFKTVPANAGTNAASYARIWGIPITDIAQANDLNPILSNGAPTQFKNITITGGMGKGLPLANPAQAGVLVKGQVYQAFANWIGTEMTLELQLSPAAMSESYATQYKAPTNFVLNYKAGGAVSAALATTLSTALPNVAQDLKISPNLVWNHDEAGYWATLPQFAEAFKRMTAGVLGSGYAGVDIAIVPPGPTIRAFDGTGGGTSGGAGYSTIAISYTDLVGEPTWIGSGQVQATCVMRADISIGDTVTLPAGLVVTTPAAMSAFSQIRQGSIFTGSFGVHKVRHVGQYKQPSGTAWVTVLDLYTTQSLV